jgi:hypothetical protein
MSSRTSIGEKLQKAGAAFLYYAVWYPRQWMYLSRWRNHAKVSGAIRTHIRFIEKTSHKLARGIFHAMARHQQGLEKRQQILARYVNIGTDLFAMAASCSRAAHLLKQNPADPGPAELADLFCKEAALRIKHEFHAQVENDDRMIYKIGRKMLEGKYQWLESGIVK